MPIILIVNATIGFASIGQELQTVGHSTTGRLTNSEFLALPRAAPRLTQNVKCLDRVFAVAVRFLYLHLSRSKRVPPRLRLVVIAYHDAARAGAAVLRIHKHNS